MSRYDVSISLVDKPSDPYIVYDIEADNRQEAKDYAIQRMAINIGKPVVIADIEIRCIGYAQEKSNEYV